MYYLFSPSLVLFYDDDSAHQTDMCVLEQTEFGSIQPCYYIYEPASLEGYYETSEVGFLISPL